MQSDITALCALAASIGFLHTAFGPDHYVPFIVMARVFSVVTIGTMLTVVLLGAWGVGFARLERWDRFSHAAAGMAIFACGLAIEFLGS